MKKTDVLCDLVGGKENFTDCCSIYYSVNVCREARRESLLDTILNLGIVFLRESLYTDAKLFPTAGHGQRTVARGLEAGATIAIETEIVAGDDENPLLFRFFSLLPTLCCKDLYR